MSPMSPAIFGGKIGAVTAVINGALTIRGNCAFYIGVFLAIFHKPPPGDK